MKIQPKTFAQSPRSYFDPGGGGVHSKAIDVYKPSIRQFKSRLEEMPSLYVLFIGNTLVKMYTNGTTNSKE
jgi:hypothetical protein